MTVFGQFLEFSVPVPDIRDSLNFYRRLGFSELSVGDVRDYHYGVITDGRIAIGLHGGGIDEPALSFVKNDVESSVRHVAPDEDTLSFVRLGNESFHEIGLHTPDGHMLIMMEARTFSQADLSELPAPVTGHIVEISLGCRDIDAAAEYWTGAGFTASDYPEDGMVELLVPGLRLGLRKNLPPGSMALRCAPGDLEQALQALERENVPVRKKGGHHRVASPEGTWLELVAAG